MHRRVTDLRSKMDGLEVYNDANEDIGSINDLLMDESGAVKIAVIGVGGFLGMRERSRRRALREAVVRQQAVASTTATKPATTTTTGAATGTEKTTTTTTSSTSRWYPRHAVFNASKDELKNVPEFKCSE